MLCKFNLLIQVFSFNTGKLAKNQGDTFNSLPYMFLYNACNHPKENEKGTKSRRVNESISDEIIVQDDWYMYMYIHLYLHVIYTNYIFR